MKKDQIKEGRISNHSRGLGTVTQEMVLARAREIALINGRSPHHLSPADVAEAKRELTGEEYQEPAEERLPTSERWDPEPGSIPHEAIVTPAHDEQTDAERLVEEGISEAEHEQMVEGTRESLRREK